MEALREALARFGNTWSREVPRTLTELYEPLQAQQNQKYGSDIRAEKALRYGPDPRNRIDVYSPASGASGRPVVVYFHGGGLVTGDNDSTPNIYANIGNYFTSNGCVTCLATYRLALQGGHHPNGAEDVAAALAWVQANIAPRGGDPSRVVALGQSAGAYHLFTALATGHLDATASAAEAPPSPPPLRAAVLLSAPFTVGMGDPAHAAAMMDWFRTDAPADVNDRCGPLALFRREFLLADPPRAALPCELLLLVGEYEADEILDGTWEFVADHRRRFGRLPVLEVLRGHNHVSYAMGLGLEAPEYERVGRRLLDAVREFTQ